MTGLCAGGSATQTPGNPEMTDWEGSLAVICDKVTERGLLYLETWEQFVFMLMVTLPALIWCMGFSPPHQYTPSAYGGAIAIQVLNWKIAVGCPFGVCGVLINKGGVFLFTYIIINNIIYPPLWLLQSFDFLHFYPKTSPALHNWSRRIHRQTIKMVALFDCYP